jgi:hypothetical protein
LVLGIAKQQRFPPATFHSRRIGVHPHGCTQGAAVLSAVTFTHEKAAVYGVNILRCQTIVLSSLKLQRLVSAIKISIQWLQMKCSSNIRSPREADKALYIHTRRVLLWHIKREQMELG